MVRCNQSTISKLKSPLQFTCRGGVCISMTARCDNINDCADKSDEADCSRVAMDPTYQRFIVPPPTPATNTTEVRVGLALSQIMDIRCASNGIFFYLFIRSLGCKSLQYKRY